MQRSGPHPSAVAPSPGLIDLHSRALELARQALSPATIRSYDLAVAKFKTFLQNHGQSWDTVNEHSLLAYLFYLHQENCAASTIAATLSALAFELKIQGLPDYTKNFKISQLLVAMRKMGGDSDRRKPITPDILSKLVESLSYLSISHYERVLKLYFSVHLLSP